MLVRPGQLAGQRVAPRPVEMIRLTIEAAPSKAGEIINQAPQRGVMPIVENWHLASDGEIEFTTRRLRAGD